MSESDAPEALEQAIGRYNDAWNAHDLDAIIAMHAPDMVFENHTAGERAVGEEAREHIGRIFHTWPDLGFVELLDADDRPVAPGEIGHVVTTSLINREQLLIRYRN